MTERQLRNDDAGVTPVVGIILMISVTVLLAATVGAFVMGMDNESIQQQAPTVVMDFDYDAADSPGESDTLAVIHNTGGGLDPDQTYVVLDGASCTGGDDPNGNYQARDDFGESQRIAAGMTMAVDSKLPLTTLCSGQLQLDAATVRLVWRSSEGTTSSTIAIWQGPNAS